jgi:hypothetical protein
MLVWKAFRFARLASVLPWALAASGVTSAASRTVSDRKLLKAAASFTTASNRAFCSGGTIGSHSFRSVSISFRVASNPSPNLRASAVSPDA